MDGELNCDSAVQFGPCTRIEPRFKACPEPGRVTLIFGPSGSGKSTILRMLAGLIPPSEGHIHCGSLLWNDAAKGVCLPPQQRKIGFLFQNYALFDHLTVKQNLSYALRKMNPATREERVMEVARMLEITDLLGQYPRTLSGGQAQRTALGRSIAPWPKWLFLDEPLSALDEPLRARLRKELRELLKRIGIPAIIVTHDSREIESLGDDLLLMNSGRVIAAGSVNEVLFNPGSITAARSLGLENVFPIEGLDRNDRDEWLLQIEGWKCLLPKAATKFPSDTAPSHVIIPPEEIIILKEVETCPENCLELSTTLVTLNKNGALLQMEFQQPKGMLVQSTPQWLGSPLPHAGDCLRLGIPFDSLRFLSPTPSSSESTAFSTKG